MIGVDAGQRCQAGAVEIDPVVMLEVRILAGIHAAGAEPQLAFVFIHLDHVADRPRALGDLRLHLAGGAVDQIEVIPAVALRHPDHFLAVGEVVAKALAGLERGGGTVVIEKGLGLFRDDRSGLPGMRVDFDHAEHLVAALVVLEAERARVFPPHQIGHVEGVGEQPRIDRDLLLAAHVEHHRLFEVEQVARLRVLHRPVLRLQLILGRRGHVVHETAIAGADAVGDDLRRIRRPGDRRRIVVVAFGPVGAERRAPVAAERTDGDVVVVDERHPLAVRRHARARRGARRDHRAPAR